MTNIKDVWDSVVPQKRSSEELWCELFQERLRIFTAFAELEIRNGGIVHPKVPLHTAKGQEVVRILSFRILEELSESIDAVDESHRKEELIDALFYLMSLFTLNLEYISIEKASKVFHSECLAYRDWMELVDVDQRSLFGISKVDLGDCTYALGLILGDTLRNRAWMNAPQDIYFSGVDKLTDTVRGILQIILYCFESFEDFHHYLLAKQEVLLFRLRTKY